MIRRLAVERDLRPHNIAAFRAARHAGRFQDKIQPEALSAAHAEILVYAAVQFEHVSASRFLVQAIDILRDNRRHPARPFHLGQPDMHDVRLCVRIKHVLFIKIVENIRMQAEKRVAEQHFRRQAVIFLRIQSVFAAKIRNPTGHRHARAAEKDNAPRALQRFAQRVHVLPLLPISVLSSFSFHCITARQR